jgi:type 1 glutamine amidotransferase
MSEKLLTKLPQLRSLALMRILRGVLVVAALTFCSAASARDTVLLIAGTQSHGPREHEYKAGCYLLQKFLKQNGVESIVVTGGWPKDDSVFEGVKSVVLFMDGGDSHYAIKGDRLKLLDGLARKGVGFAALHYAVEVPRDNGGPEFLRWIGGFYDRPYSQNPFNTPRLTQTTRQHPISRGWKDFTLRDEWYFRIRFTPGNAGVTPILTAPLPPETPNTEIVAWAFDRPGGGRGFGFTGLHIHQNWEEPNFRRLLTNAVLWTAGIEVPKSGAKCELTAGDLDQNLFEHKTAANFKEMH